jgi:hypothetical protein
MLHCICVDPAHVSKIWPMVAGQLRTAMQNGGGDFVDIEKSTLAGEKLLWIVMEADPEPTSKTLILASAVVGLHIELGRKFCCIWACAGHEKKRWLPYIKSIEDFAKEEGCSSVQIWGRRGWGREFPDYKLVQVKLEKAL